MYNELVKSGKKMKSEVCKFCNKKFDVRIIWRITIWN